MLRFILPVFLFGIIASSGSAQPATDSIRVRVFPREGINQDTTDFFRQRNQLSSVQPIFAVSSGYGNPYLGFHFDFGTIFQERIKSSYPGFLGLGIQGGIKYRSGIMAELGFSYQRFNQEAAYILTLDQTIVPGDTMTVVSQIRDGSLNVNQILITFLYSDYRSPFLPLRYVYGGIAAGATRFFEKGTYSERSISTLTGESITKVEEYSYNKWNPTVVVILGMNFLYLPESHNWFSFDIRADITPNVNKADKPLRLYQAKDLNSVRATVRFFFDYSEDFTVEE